MIVTPDITSHQSIVSFVKKLIEINVERDQKYSIRWFCQNLNWSASYINDLLSGRRKISLAKAIELGSFLQLDPLAYEALVMLAMVDHKDSSVADYYSGELSKRFGELQKTAVESNSKHFEFRSFLILEWICSLGRKPKRSEFSSLFTIDVTAQEIDEIVSFFTKNGYITLDDDGNIAAKLDGTSFDLASMPSDIRASTMRSHLVGALGYFESDTGQGSGYTISQFISLTAGDAELLKSKIDQLVKFARTLYKGPQGANTLIYQFCSTLLPHTKLK